MRTVLILNLGGTEVLGVTSLKHAHRMLHRGVAVVHAWADKDGYGGYGIPRSVELIRYVFAKWRYNDRDKHLKVFSKKGVLRRDQYLCSFCPAKATTIDHLVPRSRGGQSTWLNCAAACQSCNARKRDRTPEEAGMPLLIVPFDPGVT